MKKISFVLITALQVAMGTVINSTTVNITTSLKVGWSYTIKSPNYPNHYPPNSTWTWRILPPDVPGYGVYVLFDKFEVEPCTGCSCDVFVSSTREEGRPYYPRKVCSLMPSSYIKQLPQEQRTRPELFHRGNTDSELWLQFKSDGSSEFKGFHGQVGTSVNTRSDGCQGYMYGTSGTLFSPKYPSQYPASQSSTWLIKVPDGYKVHLTFIAFSLENTKNIHDDCINDYVEIREGVWRQGYGQILGRFCGDVIPPAVTSPTNQMWVFFASNRNVSTRYKGFRADYSIVSGCSNVLPYLAGLVMVLILQFFV